MENGLENNLLKTYINSSPILVLMQNNKNCVSVLSFTLLFG